MKQKVGILSMTKLPLIMLLIASLILFTERVGVQVNSSVSTTKYVTDKIISAKMNRSELKKNTLVLLDTADDYYPGYLEHMEYVLDDIDIGYDEYDVQKKGNIAFAKYEMIVVCVPDFTDLGDNLLPLFEWVSDGGRMMIVEPFEPTPITKTMLKHIGVNDTNGVYSIINGLTIETDFMIGSKNFVYDFDDGGEISVVNLSVADDVTVHVTSDTNIPLLWEKEYGEGRIVVNNIGAYGKSFRGYYTAAYTLLYDQFAYPVINSSIFFIDDFPAPIPTGYNKFITKFYNRDVESFYTDVWWPDMQNLAKSYGVKFTGILIEDYNKDVKAPFGDNTNISKMVNLGNTLLNMGGEIGYHGYNHQPLCYGNFDFMDKVDYTTWKTTENSKLAFDKLVEFGKDLFPTNEFQVYVPPSNILSDEGREMLVKNYPQIKTISGVYQLEDYEFEQEFDISDDGIINLPRVISGTQIEGYEKWTALNELNFHYINNHFFHPDDVLDEDRGADKGWAKMYSGLEDYVKWLYDVAPNLRSQTATDGAKAVQRYYSMTVQRELDNDKMTLNIDNYVDEAYMIVRIRKGKPGAVTGGTLEELGGELYVLTANSDQVEIKIEE